MVFRQMSMNLPKLCLFEPLICWKVLSTGDLPQPVRSVVAAPDLEQEVPGSPYVEPFGPATLSECFGFDEGPTFSDLPFKEWVEVLDPPDVRDEQEPDGLDNAGPVCCKLTDLERNGYKQFHSVSTSS